MFCSKCGNIMPDNAKFCTSCGAPVSSGSKVNEPCDHPHDTYSYSAPVYTGVVCGTPAPKVNPLEAYKQFFLRYADFSGRSRRAEYWWVILFNIIIGTIISLLDISILSTLWSLGTLIPGIALTVRRLHDVGKHGVYYLWNLLPLVGWIIVLIQLVKPSVGDNIWGRNPEVM